MNAKNFIAGLGGAIALNLLHESLKNAKDTPRIDLVGEEALQKTIRLFGGKIENPTTLYQATLAGDLISNAAYYSTIGQEGGNTWARAISMGLVAGVGAVTLPEKMGLDATPVDKNIKVKALTVGYYVAGALVTAGIFKLLSSKK